MSTEVGGWSKMSKIMSTWFLNDPYEEVTDINISASDLCVNSFVSLEASKMKTCFFIPKYYISGRI